MIDEKRTGRDGVDGGLVEKEPSDVRRHVDGVGVAQRQESPEPVRLG